MMSQLATAIIEILVAIGAQTGDKAKEEEFSSIHGIHGMLRKELANK